jgi:hypothetical protein
MQLVMWEGKAIAVVCKAAQAELAMSFDVIWDKYCSENPVPENLNLEGYDPDEQVRRTRVSAEVAYRDNLAE